MKEAGRDIGAGSSSGLEHEWNEQLEASWLRNKAFVIILTLIPPTRSCPSR